jgi:glucosamine--fructose-6-phosphate aminotransferase (isomerizing)
MTLVSEIAEQPEVLANLIEHGGDAATAAADLLASPDVHHVVIAARGTSDNAARYAKYAWGSMGRLPVTLAAPSLHSSYRTPPRFDGAAVVGISQSGQSPDLLAVVAEGRRQGRPTIGITNEPESPLADLVDVVVPLRCGRERSIAATKTYTATLMCIAMITTRLDPTLDAAELAAVPGAVAGVLDTASTIQEQARAFGPVRDCVVLGRGYQYSTAFEWALKLQEMAYVLAHPFSVADFAHGPFAVLEPDFPVLAVAVRGALFESSLEMLLRIREERDARLLTITDDPSLDVPSLVIPPTEEWLSPIPAIVAGQLFTEALAGVRGIDPEQPRGLRKVTKTT